MHLLLLDNDDSFTFNLAQQLSRLGAVVKVLSINALTVIQEEEFDALVISPGPKSPKDYPQYKEIIQYCLGQKPILGVCLGHQMLGELFGAKVLRAPAVMHGKTSLIQHTGTRLFKGMKNPLKVARYHSLIVDEVPKDFEKLAWTENGILMAMAHKEHPIFGVQFHPESFLTEEGDRLIQNFLQDINEHQI